MWGKKKKKLTKILSSVASAMIGSHNIFWNEDCWSGLIASDYIKKKKKSNTTLG